MIDQLDYLRVLEMRRENERQVSSADTSAGKDVRETELLIPVGGHHVPVIVYRPFGTERRTLPAFINIHGGGFVMAHAWMDGPYCRSIAGRLLCAVINVEYRLAPEFPFPAAFEDCYGVTAWLQTHGDTLGIDPKRIAIGGYSAGANLSAAVCLRNRQENLPDLCGQVLCYAPLNLTDENRDADDPALSSDVSRLFNRMYLQGRTMAADAYVSPLMAENVAGLPPTLLIVGGKDPLSRDSIAYAKRLSDAGVQSDMVMYSNANHGFTHDAACPDAVDAWKRIFTFLHRQFQ